MTLVYFDTNFFYNVVDQAVDQNTLSALREWVEKSDARCFYTPISFVEIAGHITQAEADKFTRFKATLEWTKSTCGNNMLDNPDLVLARTLDVPPPTSDDEVRASELNRVRDLICSASSYEQLVSGQRGYWNGRPSLVRFRDGVLSRFRDENEERWVQDLYDHVVGLVNPDYLSQREGGGSLRVKDADLRKRLLGLLESPTFEREFLQACITKAIGGQQSPFVQPLPDPVVRNHIERVSGYFTAYKTILRQMIVTGYRPKRNDLNDLHFLIYLAMNPDTVFVTHDKKLTAKVQGCSQARQVMTVKGLIGAP